RHPNSNLAIHHSRRTTPASYRTPHHTQDVSRNSSPLHPLHPHSRLRPAANPPILLKRRKIS
ncbi:hypothetical protein EJ06DRAFT_515090, partial [Trichodelitschia bisporula]